MRHRVAGKHLNRTSAHRKALRRNLAASLFEHGTISTTREKARFVQPFAEKLITLAKDGSLHARRRAISLLQDRDICKVEAGEPAKETTVVHRLFSEIGPRFQNRNGGYTRVIRLPLRRVGDNGQLVLLQLVDAEPPAAPKARDTRPADTPVVDVPGKTEAEASDETIRDNDNREEQRGEEEQEEHSDEKA